MPHVVHRDIASKRVLVVDDNEVNRHLLMRLLPDWGLEPVCASDGFEALELFQQSQADVNLFPLVLLDQNMPRMDGYAVAERIRKLAPMEKVAILILTSAPNLDDQARDQRLGIARKIAKPLRRAALQDAVFQALGARPHPKRRAPTRRRRPMEMACGCFWPKTTASIKRLPFACSRSWGTTWRLQ